jgi:hypothetical protein
VDDELGDHRVVEDRDRVALDHARVDAHALRVVGGQAKPLEPAGARQEPGFRILRIQPHLDGVAVLRDGVLWQRQRLAGGDAQLPFDQVQAGDHLGHRMFDLQARVDLHEVEATVLTDDELHRAGVDVVDRARGQHCGGAHGFAQFGGEERRGGFLQHLLVAALRRAFALVEVQRVAVRVGEDLDLDVARLLDIALSSTRSRPEGVACFSLAAFEIRSEFGTRTHDAHALAAAAVGGLDHQRIADGVGFKLQ